MGHIIKWPTKGIDFLWHRVVPVGQVTYRLSGSAACLPAPSVGKKCTKHAPGCDVCVPFEGQSNGGLIIPPIGHVTPVPVSQTVRSVVAVVVLGSWVSVVCPFAGLKFGVHTLPMMMMMRLRLVDDWGGNGVVHRFVYVSSWMHTI